MEFEILNNARVTPHRVHALVRLVLRVRTPTRDRLRALLQPPELGLEQHALFNEVYRAAINSELLVEDENGVVRLSNTDQEVESVNGFRKWLQGQLLSVTDQYQANFLLNIFAAWYATQDDDVLRMEDVAITDSFDDQVFPHVEERTFNTTKFNGWQTWSTFLGLGWYMPLGTSHRVVPDAHVRIEPLLPALLPEPEDQKLGLFLTRLARECPELDGGELYDHCLSRTGMTDRGNRLSLMLSNALRGLHRRGKIQLSRRADALETWRLFYSDVDEFNEISHIRREAA